MLQGIIGFRQVFAARISSYKFLTSNRVTTFLARVDPRMFTAGQVMICKIQWLGMSTSQKRTWSPQWELGGVKDFGASVSRKVPPTSWGSSRDLHHYVTMSFGSSRSRCHLQRFCHQKDVDVIISSASGRDSVGSVCFVPSRWEKRQMRFDRLWKRSDSSLPFLLLHLLHHCLADVVC